MKKPFSELPRVKNSAFIAYPKLASLEKPKENWTAYLFESWFENGTIDNFHPFMDYELKNQMHCYTNNNKDYDQMP